MAAGLCTGTASGFGHVIVDYEKAITRGFRAIIAEAQALLADTPSEDAEGRAFLEGVVIAAEGIIRWAERYADLAESAGRRRDATRSARPELQQIARTCRRVPAEPARDFREALQSFLVHPPGHAHRAVRLVDLGRTLRPVHVALLPAGHGVRAR